MTATETFQKIQELLGLAPSGVPGDNTTERFKALCEAVLRERDAIEKEPE